MKNVVSIVLFVAIALSGVAANANGVASTAAFNGVSSKIAPPETGSLDDLKSPIWQSAFHVSTFENFTTRADSSEKTEAYLVFGPDSIYCAFVSEQNSGKIISTQTTNNVGLGLDDYVSLMFDTSGNGTNQYFFETTPAGLRYQAASESTRYAPTWTAVGHIFGNRWLGELAIPYRYLRGSARVWRVNFARYLAGTQQFYSWAYEGQMSSPFGENFWPSIRDVPALTSSASKPTIQIYGLASGGTDRHVFEGSAGEFDASQTRNIGVDAKVPLTPSLNFDGTLNPDFSNVENDQQVISPQEFRYQYSEYRPFFTQGANYLPGSEVFYSPSVGIFDHGEKIEGQVGYFGIGALNVGAYGASDRAFSFSYGAPNQETSVSVSGAQADRLNESDSVFEISANNTVHGSQLFYGAATAVDSDSAVTRQAEAMRSLLYLGVSKPNYSVLGAYYDVGPQYHPTDAYLAENDIHGPQVTGSLSSTTSTTAPIRYLSLSGYLDRYLDDSGAVHEADSGTTGSITFKDLLSLSIGQSLSSLRNYVDAYPAYCEGTTYPYDQSTVSASYRAGTPNTEALSYSWGQYPTYFLQQINGSVSHQIADRFTAEFDYGQVLERNFIGSANGQTLERLTLFGSLSRDQTVSLAYRLIDGTGGFSSPGTNLAFSYFRRFGKGNTLQAEFGSPAASRTLNRYIIKYVLLVGSGASE